MAAETQIQLRADSGFLAVAAPPPFGSYSAEEDEKEYARALLKPEELRVLKVEVESQGFLSAAAVRALVAANTGSRLTPEGIFVLDADLIAQIDMRTNVPMFVLPDNTVYSREELLAAYPFAEFRTAPEKIFAQQEIGVFPVRASNLDQTAKEYLARDLGSGDEFVMFEDFIGREARADYVDRRPCERTVKTKVFLARDGWDDFMALSKHVRALRRLMKVSGHPAGDFGALLGASQAASAPLYLESAESISRRLDEQAREMEAREVRLREQEARLAEQTQKLSDLLAGL